MASKKRRGPPAATGSGPRGGRRYRLWAEPQPIAQSRRSRRDRRAVQAAGRQSDAVIWRGWEIGGLRVDLLRRRADCYQRGARDRRIAIPSCVASPFLARAPGGSANRLAVKTAISGQNKNTALDIVTLNLAHFWGTRTGTSANTAARLLRR
jgi:hypothetical protein